MKIAAAFGLVLLSCPSVLEAKEVNRVVASGQTTKMQDYKSWNDSCVSGTGVVKVATRPQHGKLSTVIVDSVIGPKSRIPRAVNCTGKPVKAFRVNYTSDRGFHGVDRFSIEVSWPHPAHQDIDNYTVTVQ